MFVCLGALDVYPYEPATQCEDEKSSTTIARPRLINILPPPVMVEDVLRRPAHDDELHVVEQQQDNELESSSVLSCGQAMGSQEHSITNSNTSDDGHLIQGACACSDVSTHEHNSSHYDFENHKSRSTSVAVQTEEICSTSFYYNIPPSTATIFTNDHEHSSDVSAGHKTKSWSFLQDIPNLESPSPTGDDYGNSGKQVLKDPSNDSWTGIDSLLSTNLLKEYYHIRYHTPVPIAKSLLEFIDKCADAVKKSTSLDNNNPNEPLQGIHSVHSRADSNQQENSDTESGIPHGESLDINPPGDPTGGETFYTVAASLQEANALPSQIHARREHIRQQIQDQRKRAKVITNYVLMNFVMIFKYNFRNKVFP